MHGAKKIVKLKPQLYYLHLNDKESRYKEDALQILKSVKDYVNSGIRILT